MKYFSKGLLVCLLIAAGCDRPDEVEVRSDVAPEDRIGDPNRGIDSVEGDKGWWDETTTEKADAGTVLTVEVCDDATVAKKQKWMVKQDVTPLVGAGGLDMRGFDEDAGLDTEGKPIKFDWSGLTVDQAQGKELLCQASYYGDGVATWGDQSEVIAFWDLQSREIYDMLITPGYEKPLDATYTPKSGDPVKFVWTINESITKNGVKLEMTDGGDLDPRSSENMDLMNKALIQTYRKGMVDDIDTLPNCSSAGTCYVVMSGTEPVLVFISVDVYLRLEPTKHRLSTIETALKRPFHVAMTDAELDGVTPTLKGNALARIPDCEVTYGTTYQELKEKCLDPADDPVEMAAVTAQYNNEYIAASMGGITFMFQRPTLAETEVLPLNPTLEPEDTVAIMSINAGFEGEVGIPFSPVVESLKKNMLQEIRDNENKQSLTLEDVGLNTLRAPNDPHLPAAVKAVYSDVIRPGGISAAFCDDLASGGDSDTDTDTDADSDTDTDTGTDVEEYPSCDVEDDGKFVLRFTGALLPRVTAALAKQGIRTTEYSERAFYVNHVERAIGEYIKGSALLPSEMVFKPSEATPDRVRATLFLKQDIDEDIEGPERYVVSIYYGGNDDRWHFLQFNKGLSRSEEVLLKNAEITGSGTFEFRTLVLGSSFLGLNTKYASVKQVVPEYRRALMNFKLGLGDNAPSMKVLAPYLPASNLVGYWTPIQGVRSVFNTADYFSLPGTAIGAEFYMAPESATSSTKKIVAIYSGTFFGSVVWCGIPNIKLGDSAEALLTTVADEGYPCDMIVRRSSNNQYITSIYDMDTRMVLIITNDVITSVGAWAQ